MKITDELIDHLSKLSRLELTEEETIARRNDLTDILSYMEKLNELDTEGADEMTHPYRSSNRFREDRVTNSDRHEDMLRNAPDSKGDFFRVKRAVEE